MSGKVTNIEGRVYLARLPSGDRVRIRFSSSGDAERDCAIVVCSSVQLQVLGLFSSIPRLTVRFHWYFPSDLAHAQDRWLIHSSSSMLPPSERSSLLDPSRRMSRPRALSFGGYSYLTCSLPNSRRDGTRWVATGYDVHVLLTGCAP